MKYTALGEGLVTNIVLGFTCAIFATRLAPRAVYFMQTGSSVLSNTCCLSTSITLCIHYTVSSLHRVRCATRLLFTPSLVSLGLI